MKGKNHGSQEGIRKEISLWDLFWKIILDWRCRGVFIGLYDISTDRWIYERTEIL